MPQWQQSLNLAKYLSTTFWPTKPQRGGGGHAMLVAYAKPLGEPTFHVWLLYQHPFFKHEQYIDSSSNLCFSYLIKLKMISKIYQHKLLMRIILFSYLGQENPTRTPVLGNLIRNGLSGTVDCWHCLMTLLFMTSQRIPLHYPWRRRRIQWRWML